MMTNSFGRALSLSLFGSSHSDCVGGTLSGIPAGIHIDFDELQAEMARRAPGKAFTSARREPDEVIITQGISNNLTDGGVISFKIPNKDVKTSDYISMPGYRPSHGDYTYAVKYPGRSDNRPSGRMTAPLVAAGYLCRKALEASMPDFCAGAHIKSLYTFEDNSFSADVSAKTLKQLRAQSVPTLKDEGPEIIKTLISEAVSEGDSLGGRIECAFTGLPVGLGEPFFHSLDAELSSLLFSIPGVKGVEFGEGSAMAAKKGSEHNDPFVLDSYGSVRTLSNSDGGVQGGLSNGMPLCFTVLFKPTPSILKEQQTVGFDGTPVRMSIHGRHDPCILLRAVPVVEACGCIALYDLVLQAGNASETRNLAQIRAEISQIDDKLAQLMKARFKAVSEVAVLKKSLSLPVSDPAREAEETARLIDGFFTEEDASARARFEQFMNNLYLHSKEQQHETD